MYGHTPRVPGPVQPCRRTPSYGNNNPTPHAKWEERQWLAAGSRASCLSRRDTYSSHLAGGFTASCRFITAAAIRRPFSTTCHTGYYPMISATAAAHTRMQERHRYEICAQHGAFGATRPAALHTASTAGDIKSITPREEHRHHAPTCERLCSRCKA